MPSYRGSVPTALDLDGYRLEAEEFISALDREYLEHLSGRKPELELDPIYGRYGGLFERSAVEELRDRAEAAADGDDARAARYLLQFAVDGLLGRETKAESERAAELEASLEVEAAGRRIPYRQVPVEQANEPDADARAELEAARDALLAEQLNPLHVAAIERSHELCRELGWQGYADAYSQLRALDLEGLAGTCRGFLERTADAYPRLVDPHLAAAGLPPLGEVRRSDLARFFRASELDAGFPAERLLASFEATVSGLGIELGAQPGVHVDAEPRPTKSPRAFCAPVRVPEEVHLVIAPVGGRDDFAALMHEGGHTEHYANVEPGLGFEFRHLGDNAVTESFAFLFEHLTEDAEWLRAVLGIEDAEAVIAQAQAVRLVFLRRYSAKIAYELELHAPAPDLEAMPERYAALLGSATRVRWPEVAWASDVDAGFYVACYLRAWALAALWRRTLRERFGERWFASAEAGAWLRRLWSQGQRLSAEELLASELGGELEFGALAAEFA
jgi:hypothetical protein